MTKWAEWIKGKPTCAKCGGPMVGGSRAAGPSQVEEFQFCVRCRAETDHKTVDGWIESNCDWFVRVDLPPVLGAPQLAAIRRAHAAFHDVGLADVRKALAAQPVAIVGPYASSHDAAAQRDRLRAVGLVAEVD